MFLPISREDMAERGIEQLDYIVVTGDAYVDHPSFGAAIIGRLLEAEGYQVGVIAQPNWKDHEDISKLGIPKYAFLVTGGNIDSMVNHYSVTKKRRHEDAYSPGNKEGLRPDRATTVYCNLIRQAFKQVPIIIGGIEASLRRMAHYDYWSDQVKRSILLDSQADLLVYGMAERTIIEIANALASGLAIEHLTFIKGTCYRATSTVDLVEPILLSTYQTIKSDKMAYAKSFKLQSEYTDMITEKALVEPYSDREFIVQLPPQPPLSTSEFDRVYGLNYERNYHPIYESVGGVPAITEVKFSIIANRGCYGGCNFCALTFHQGRIMQARSQASILREAEAFTWDPDFKGYIHDVGGPTANFRNPSCKKQLTKGVCVNKQCLVPERCVNLDVDHREYADILRKLRALPKVKKVFVRSGIRFDYLLYDKDTSFFNELVEHHISGQLKVAPEHVDDTTLAYMGKPAHHVYEKFRLKYDQKNQAMGKKQYLVPYLMSSHPGSDLASAIKLAEYLRDINHQPQQVQDFYPTPATASTTMYHTGLDPRTLKPVFVPKTANEKAMQRALIQYKKPQNYNLVYEALKQAGREDLIGFDKHCLIRPKSSRQGSRGSHTAQQDPKSQGASRTKGSATLGKAKKSEAKSTGGAKPKKKKTIRNLHKPKKG